MQGWVVEESAVGGSWGLETCKAWSSWQWSACARALVPLKARKQVTTTQGVSESMLMGAVFVRLESWVGSGHFSADEECLPGAPSCQTAMMVDSACALF